MDGATANVDRWLGILAPLLEEPATAAVLLDLDGTLAPIVTRPEDAAIPERARSCLARIADRYGLCAVVTGRPPLLAREMTGLDRIAIAGNHGFELLEAGAELPRPAPALRGRAEDAFRFLDSGVDPAALGRAGVRIEDKGPIVALHWRAAADQRRAERVVEEVARSAEAAGLLAHRGRKVLELRPAVAIDKGGAVEALIGRNELRAALFAGDDRTDLDGFRALVRAREAGRLEAVVRVGVRSPEGPPEIVEEADLVVEGTERMTDLLEVLAG